MTCQQCKGKQLQSGLICIIFLYVTMTSLRAFITKTNLSSPISLKTTRVGTGADAGLKYLLNLFLAKNAANKALIKSNKSHM